MEKIPLLCIIGPTAVGKTKLATYIHQQFPSILISADSRQVYRGMDIVVGKDHDPKLNLYGIDLVAPDYDFSVSNWCDYVEPIILTAHQKKKLPIIVGGTGFYLNALINRPATLGIPQDKTLRESLSQASIFQLQEQLKLEDPKKFSLLNPSDQRNPRRLVRALEVAQAHKENNSKIVRLPKYQPYIIGLEPPIDKDDYLNQIKERVRLRLDLGALEETISLVSKYPKDLPAFSALGYNHIIRHLEGDLNTEELVESWARDEYLYTKRQLLYFNKFFEVIWGQNNHLQAQVISWYAKLKI